MNADQHTTSRARALPLQNAVGWGASVLLMVLIVGAYLWINHAPPQRAAANPVWFEAPSLKKVEKTMASAPATVAVMTPQQKMNALGQLARVDRLLRDYRRTYGEFPTGSNVDITRTLRGDNEKKIVFVTPEELPISARGELLDTWRTPYFFHQISGTHMEIMSAGPDRQMWTADDLKVAAQ